MLSSKQWLEGMLKDWENMDLGGKASATGRLMILLVREAQTEGIADVLSASEVCKILNMSKPTLYKYAQFGVVPGTKIGTRWVFKRSDIDDLMLSKLNGIWPFREDKGPGQ